jgi:hypothetical protein
MVQDLKEPKPKTNLEIKKEDDGTVTIKKTELSEIMERLKRVESAADKSHLAHFDEKNKKPFSKTVRLRTIEGKVVLKWDDMVVNLVEKSPNGAWREDQVIRIYFEDDTSAEMDLVIFNRRFVHIKAEIVSETKTGEDTVLKVKTEDGREYEINQKFIN